MTEEQKQLEQKEPLGFGCGKKCQHCGDKVSRDGQGRYLCFTCGKLVEVKK
jgi:DNA-directed RNA polymerase subunit RPC12/RpoP